MRKAGLIITYLAFALLLLTLVSTTDVLLSSVKYLLLLLLSASLFLQTVASKRKSSLQWFNLLFFGTAVSFTLYASLFKDALYFNILFELFVAALLGLVLSLVHKEKVARKIRPPKKPAVVVKEIKEVKPVSAANEVKQESKPIVRKVAKSPAKKATTKKTTKKVAKKTSTRKKAAKKVAKKSTAKKVAKKSSKKKAAKKATKSKSTKKKVTKKAPAKKSSKKTPSSTARGNRADANLISFTQNHELNYVLRKYGKRLTVTNRALLREVGVRFKKNTQFKPHNRENFYKYVERYSSMNQLE